MIIIIMGNVTSGKTTLGRALLHTGYADAHTEHDDMCEVLGKRVLVEMLPKPLNWKSPELLELGSKAIRIQAALLNVLQREAGTIVISGVWPSSMHMFPKDSLLVYIMARTRAEAKRVWIERSSEPDPDRSAARFEELFPDQTYEHNVTKIREAYTNYPGPKLKVNTEPDVAVVLGLLDPNLATEMDCPCCGQATPVHVHDANSDRIACMECAGITYDEFLKMRDESDLSAHPDKAQPHATYQGDFPECGDDIMADEFDTEPEDEKPEKDPDTAPIGITETDVRRIVNEILDERDKQKPKNEVPW